MSKQDSVSIVNNFWREVWQAPQNVAAIDQLVDPDFVITTGGKDIAGPENFKSWVKNFQSMVTSLEFHIVETFQNEKGDRVASRWRITGRNNGLMGTEPDGAALEITGTAIWDVGPDGLLRHNWVERNALEVYDALTQALGRAP